MGATRMDTGMGTIRLVPLGWVPPEWLLVSLCPADLSLSHGDEMPPGDSISQQQVTYFGSQGAAQTQALAGEL